MMNDEQGTPPRSVASTSADHVRMSPKARRLAREHGIEPSKVRGSGADGAVLADDVFRAVADAACARADAERTHAAHLAEEAVRFEQQRRAAEENARIERERLAAAAAAEVARLERERAASAAAVADRERMLVAEMESVRAARERAEADLARLQAQRARVEAESANLAAERTGIEAERARLEMERAALEVDRARLATERTAADARRVASANDREDTARTARDHVPQLVVRRDVDALALVTASERLSDRMVPPHPAPLSHLDIIVAAVARALRQHPQMNARWGGEGVVQNDAINVALAVASGNDVVMPVMFEADRASLGELAQRRHELVARAESGHTQPSDLAGATFTITHVGVLSVDAFAARVVAPQACHLAVGAIVDRVIAIDGLIGVRPTISLTLSCDDRIVHAPRAAAFLNDVAIALSEPHKWT